MATPKSQAKEPIQLDIILVCRKSEVVLSSVRDSIPDSLAKARAKLLRLVREGFDLSRNDRKIVLFGQVLTAIATAAELTSAVEAAIDAELDRSVELPLRSPMQRLQPALFET